MEKGKSLYLACVDLEKAYDRIQRRLVYWCLKKKGVPERLVRIVQDTYEGTVTRVRAGDGEQNASQLTWDYTRDQHSTHFYLSS